MLADDSRPAFAAIAALICVGVIHGRRGERAVHLAVGVLVGQVRSTAVDLVRAAELVADQDDDPLHRPTEELLA